MKHALNFFSPKSLFAFDDDWFDFSKNPLFGISKNFADSPKVNVKETDKAYEIEIANPGFGKEDTNIKIKDHVIYVEMNLETETKDEDEKDHKYHVKQWKKSSYQESWNIPENVDEEQISAKHNDGVLTIILPKKEVFDKDTSRVINIE